jgi:hypothetical protein
MMGNKQNIVQWLIIGMSFGLSITGALMNNVIPLGINFIEIHPILDSMSGTILMLCGSLGFGFIIFRIT